MAFILTFLGKGGVGSTTIAIASAKKYAQAGKKVLLVSQDSSPTLALQLGVDLTSGIQEIEPNLSVIGLQSTSLLESSWEELKKQEAKYLRSPVLNNIFPEELALIPGMDDALALNFLREQDNAGYDVIVYDGKSSLNTVRMFGIPDVISWYIRRVKNLLENSDIIKALSPFIQPVTSAVLNVSWSADNFADQPTREANSMLDAGKAAVADPKRVAAFLVTDGQAESIASAKYWWGCAQQAGVTVGGLIVNQDDVSDDITEQFKPLNITASPSLQGDNWDALQSSLPDFKAQAGVAPPPLIVDTADRKVKVFLPGFKKKQVKLTQSGPEITISAGDQRRNIFLPPALKGAPVKGAKFENAYLVISL